MDDAIWSLLTRVYQAFTDGDRDTIDAQLDPAATIWDSGTRELLRGKADLDRVRAARTEPPEGIRLKPYDPVINVYGEFAVACYWLAVDYGAGGRTELIRNTAVLRRADTPSGWHVIHLHEDVQ